MSKYLKSLSEIATCAAFYSTFHYFEKKQLFMTDDLLTIDLWKEEMNSSWLGDSLQVSTIALQAGLTYMACRTVSPVISNKIVGGLRSFDPEIIMASASTATTTFPKQSVFLTAAVGTGIIALQPILSSSLNLNKTPEELRREAIDPRWFKYLSVDILLDTFLFSSYLFRRLYLLAGPVVAHAGTAISYAISHKIRHYDRNDQYHGPTTFISDLTNALCAQYAYHMTGSIILPFLCHCMTKYQEVGLALAWSFLETHSFWRNIIMNSLTMYSFGSTTSNNHQILVIHKVNQRRGQQMTTEDKNAAKSFVEKYVHVYCPENQSKELHWEDLADILYNFRSVTANIVYQSVDLNNSNGYYQNPQHPDLLVVTFPQDKTAIASLIATDSLYSKALAHYRKGDVITKEELVSILFDDLLLFSIDLEKLKSFEQKFLEMTSLWDPENSNVSENQIIDMIDRYYKSILLSILNTTPSIPSHERSGSLPVFPEGIIEGITVSSSPSSSSSSRKSNNFFSFSSFQDYSLASRRGAMSSLNQSGLTIRKWNELLTLYSEKYPRVNERKEKWIQYLNGEEFQQIIEKMKPGQAIQDTFDHDLSFLDSGSFK
jgi:hypothetical protein